MDLAASYPYPGKVKGGRERLSPEFWENARIVIAILIFAYGAYGFLRAKMGKEK
jgi:hypothetical protein